MLNERAAIFSAFKSIIQNYKYYNAKLVSVMQNLHLHNFERQIIDRYKIRDMFERE